MNNGVWINSQSFCWLSATKSSSSQSVLLSYIFYWMLFLYHRARDSFFFKDENREKRKKKIWNITAHLKLLARYEYDCILFVRNIFIFQHAKHVHKHTNNTQIITQTEINTYTLLKIPPFLSDYDSIPFSRCVDFLNKPYSNEFYLIE